MILNRKELKNTPCQILAGVSINMRLQLVRCLGSGDSGPYLLIALHVQHHLLWASLGRSGTVEIEKLEVVLSSFREVKSEHS